MGQRRWFSSSPVKQFSKPVSLVEIAGDGRVLIEHHQGVSSYTSESVDVCVSYGQVCVTGSRLCIARMTPEQLVIRGIIEGVRLLKNGGNHGR